MRPPDYASSIISYQENFHSLEEPIKHKLYWENKSYETLNQSDLHSLQLSRLILTKCGSCLLIKCWNRNANRMTLIIQVYSGPSFIVFLHLKINRDRLKFKKSFKSLTTHFSHISCLQLLSHFSLLLKLLKKTRN